MSYKEATFLLLGDPVSHSLSPLIHNTAFSALGLPFHYAAHRIPMGDETELEKVIREIDGVSLVGVNVTIPHKSAVVPFLDDLTPIARKVGAVNTIYIENGRKVGHNTDVEGFLSPLAGMKLDNKEVVVLGSGGAARAVMVAAQSGLNASRISVVSRNLDSARAACTDLNIGEVRTYADLPELLSTASLIVNATPVGMWPETNQSPLKNPGLLSEKHTVYDLIYNPTETELLRSARIQGASIVGGLQMLIAQAAGAFRIWTGSEMPVKDVSRTINNYLKSTLN
ncbi:MAG: shikimate dehydrogenase [Bacteroidetes bacterium]|nr:shikimate dehydrogenase [Bacteroidota bacterium]